MKDDRGTITLRRTGKWARVLLGLAIFGHVLLHALPGMTEAGATRGTAEVVAWQAIWTVATLSLIGSTFGLWGWGFFKARWRQLTYAGVAASVLLLIASGRAYTWPGLAFDILLVYFASGPTVEQAAEPKRRRSFFGVVGRAFGIAIMIHFALSTALHSWIRNWGATPEEMARFMPGDRTGDSRDHYLDHVITVNAPPERVWPYLVQIGQDKAGFYSYDILERAVGADIHNNNRVVPEFQHLREGDSIRLMQPNSMFGVPSEGVALKVLKIEPNKMMQLEGWGTFWIEPLPGGGCRLGVRTAVADMPFWAGPMEAYLFEPMHFTMQQKMLRSIRDLAEQGV